MGQKASIRLPGRNYSILRGAKPFVEELEELVGTRIEHIRFGKFSSCKSDKFRIIIRSSPSTITFQVNTEYQQTRQPLLITLTDEEHRGYMLNLFKKYNK